MASKLEQKRAEIAEKRKALEAWKQSFQLTHVEPSVSGLETAEVLLEKVRTDLDKLSIQQPAAQSHSIDPALSSGGRFCGKSTKTVQSILSSLSVSPAQIKLSIDPKDELRNFDKSCQCDLSDIDQEDTDRDEELVRKHSGPESKDLVDQINAASAVSVPDHVSQPEDTPELPEETKEHLLCSPHFDAFFSKAALIMEKALKEELRPSILDDFVTLTDADLASRKTHTAELEFDTSYLDQRWSRERRLNDVKCHPTLSHSFLAAYGPKPQGKISDPDGCVLIWNRQLSNRPEYSFYCHSSVCTATFDSFNPHCVFGGVYSGSILLWDTREKAHPVLRTLLSPTSHRTPVYSVHINGTSTAHQIVSADRDGRICVWSRAMMTQPTETLDLRKGANKYSILCMKFQAQDNPTFIAGGDDGSLLTGRIHQSQDKSIQVHAAHGAPVTQLDWHPGHELDDQQIYSDLVLSSSIDGAIKLHTLSTTADAILSFETLTDSYYDVQWHPTNPSLFAATRADRGFCVWDLTTRSEVPVLSHETQDSAALKLSWGPCGTSLLVGTDQGTISAWKVPHTITEFTQEKHERTAECIQTLRQAPTERF